MKRTQRNLLLVGLSVAVFGSCAPAPEPGLTASAEGAERPGHDEHDDHHDDHHDEGPRLHSWFEADRERHDFAAVYEGSLQEARFELVAAGPDPVVVERIAGSSASVDGVLRVLGTDGVAAVPAELKRAYEPGTRFELLATLDTKGRFGDQTHKLHLVLGGQSERVSFVLRAHVEAFLRVEPHLLDFGRFPSSSGARQSAIVSSAHGQAFALRADRVPAGLRVAFEPADDFEGEFEGQISEGRAPRWRMHVSIEPGASPGVASHRLTLTTDVAHTGARPVGAAPTHQLEIWLRGVVDES